MAIGQNAPSFGVKETAGMTPTELTSQDLLSQYAAEQSPEVTAALASLSRAGQTTNLMDIPEYAALYNTGKTDINSQLNRIGRTLQLGGNTSSSTGSKVITNAVGDQNAKLLASMAPYAAQERDRSFNAPITAANLASTDTQNRLGAVKNYGALPRELQQLSFDAQYMSDYINEIAPYTYQVPALSAVGGIGNTVVTGGGLTDIGMILQAAAGAAGSAAGAGAGKG